MSKHNGNINDYFDIIRNNQVLEESNSFLGVVDFNYLTSDGTYDPYMSEDEAIAAMLAATFRNAQSLADSTFDLQWYLPYVSATSGRPNWSVFDAASKRNHYVVIHGGNDMAAYVHQINATKLCREFALNILNIAVARSCKKPGAWINHLTTAGKMVVYLLLKRVNGGYDNMDEFHSFVLGEHSPRQYTCNPKTPLKPSRSLRALE